MKPIILSGHSRPIKDLKFSANSEHLFSASNDRNVILWAAETGQKLMNYQHTAAVNTLGLTSDGKLLVTGDNTGTSYIWDVQGGNLLKKMENENLVNLRSLEISNDDKKVVLVLAGRTKESSSSVNIYNLLDIFMNNFGKETITTFDPLLRIDSLPNQKYVSSKFSKDDSYLYLSREDGTIEIMSIKDAKMVKQKKFHDGIITDIDISSDEQFMITSSIDGYSKIIDLNTFEVVKSFHPENPTRNINACKFSPLGHKSTDGFNAVVAGGQDSRNVTTTNAKEGGFDLEFFNVNTGKIVGSIKGHFGPVNTLAFSPSSKFMASGAEDATVRVQKIESNYFDNLSARKDSK